MSFAPRLHEHFPSQDIITSEEDIIDASLILQYISMKYILVLHNNISYLHGRVASILSQVELKVFINI